MKTVESRAVLQRRCEKLQARCERLADELTNLRKANDMLLVENHKTLSDYSRLNLLKINLERHMPDCKRLCVSIVIPEDPRYLPYDSMFEHIGKHVEYEFKKHFWQMMNQRPMGNEFENIRG